MIWLRYSNLLYFLLEFCQLRLKLLPASPCVNPCVYIKTLKHMKCSITFLIPSLHFFLGNFCIIDYLFLKQLLGCERSIGSSLFFLKGA